MAFSVLGFFNVFVAIVSVIFFYKFMSMKIIRDVGIMLGQKLIKLCWGYD